MGSAAILLRSGIGPARDLTGLGIEIVADLPVGQRLHDQPVYHGVYALKAEAGAKSPAAGALIRTASSQAQGQELDLLVSAAHLNDGGVSPTGAIVLAVAVVRPESRGKLTLSSADPKVAAGHRPQPARHARRSEPNAGRHEAEPRDWPG